MEKFIVSTFTAGMISSKKFSVSFENVELETAQRWIEENQPISAVGHAQTAEIASNWLGKLIAFNRLSLAVKDCQLLIVQYKGPRLPEGATKVPEGATFELILATVSCKD